MRWNRLAGARGPLGVAANLVLFTWAVPGCHTMLTWGGAAGDVELCLSDVGVHLGRDCDDDDLPEASLVTMDRLARETDGRAIVRFANELEYGQAVRLLARLELLEFRHIRILLDDDSSVRALRQDWLGQPGCSLIVSATDGSQPVVVAIPSDSYLRGIYYDTETDPPWGGQFEAVRPHVCSKGYRMTSVLCQQLLALSPPNASASEALKEHMAVANEFNLDAVIVGPWWGPLALHPCPASTEDAGPGGQ